MSYRNMKRTVQTIDRLFMQNKDLSHYAMNIDEMCDLHQMCLDGKDIEAVNIAFLYGFVLGTRALSRNTIKKAL